MRYRISAPPLTTRVCWCRVCWCRVCQYLAAGNGTVNTCFPKEALQVEGSLSDYRSAADSGNVMHRRFCPKCGTPIWACINADLPRVAAQPPPVS